MSTALFVAIVAGLAAGWRLRVWYVLAQAKRAVREMRRTDAVCRRREAVARRERGSCWHIEAETPADALRCFHLRAQIGGPGVWS